MMVEKEFDLQEKSKKRLIIFAILMIFPLFFLLDDNLPKSINYLIVFILYLFSISLLFFHLFFHSYSSPLIILENGIIFPKRRIDNFIRDKPSIIPYNEIDKVIIRYNTIDFYLKFHSELDKITIFLPENNRPIPEQLFEYPLIKELQRHIDVIYSP